MLTADDALIRLLYEGVFDTPLWSAFLNQLCSRTGARGGSLRFGVPDGGSPAILLAGESSRREDLSFQAMREGRVYSLEDLLDLGELPSGRVGGIIGGASSLRAVRVTEPGGLDVWLCCEGENDLGPSVGALLNALAPHLRTALRNFVVLERERLRSAVAEEAVERLSLGWIALDSKCTILAASPQAEEMFRWGGLLRKGRYDRLVPASPVIDRQIAALVKGYAAGGEARPRAFTLSQDPWCHMLLTPAARRSIAEGLNPAAIAYVSGDRSSQADRWDQLVDLFGLLPSEARLAWVLAQAASIPEAAGRLGITVETARNYSKKIYAKTGARGHAELVRLVLTSVMTIG